MKTMAEAFHHTLKDIYYAENALTKAMPKMASAVGDGDIKKAFDDHLKETKEHVKILKKVFATIDKPAEGEKCDAIEGLIKETEGIIEEASGKALGACLIGAAQAVEHYEIARYGTLRQWAKELKNDEAHELLSQILDMEKAANAKLTGIAVAAA
ncbi:ferritin-like metal-binding protein YciE [Primorskyibacter sedentarius]|uniref:Ferritin-like metal-binding protein YciE n=1 Tax=Primorskyibacter sedentarius TaxID=745311 RepID=A0A4R3IQC3_9RHOB|nr:ferritin-like domain-containing protein [Primorskyibacter sedentarius]TCS52245.1 ferritin-like metal-binding protein YciE [Primorskyibacter sedentarius]